MLYINKLTDDPQQQVNLIGIPGITIQMTLRFMPRTEQWIMGIVVGETSIQGIAVTTSINILQQFKNTLGFGIACVMGSGLDPFTINDFATEAANLYLLDSDDLAELDAQLFT